VTGCCCRSDRRTLQFRSGQAVATYAAQVGELARIGAPAYLEAAGLVARMGGLRSVDESLNYPANLRERHMRKRNFIKRLDQLL